jgi:hypothetical protein
MDHDSWRELGFETCTTGERTYAVELLLVFTINFYYHELCKDASTKTTRKFKVLKMAKSLKGKGKAHPTTGHEGSLVVYMYISTISLPRR